MEHTLQRLAYPLAVASGASLFFILIRTLLLRQFERWSKESPLDRAVIHVFKTPSIAWCVAIGLYLGIAFSDLPDRQTRPLYQAIHVVLVFSLTLVLANVTAQIFRHLMNVGEARAGTSGLAIGMIKGGIFTVGILIALSMVGISITPVLGALGVGGLAIALALKDTLENLFSGIYLIGDRAVRVGDFVKLETGHEGTVEDIGWRTTRICLRNNNTVIIPNSKLSQSIVTNYSYPDPRMSVSVRISVSSNNDPLQVDKILQEVSRQASRDISGMLSVPEPTVYLVPSSAVNSLEFVVGFNVKHVHDAMTCESELRKRIFERFYHEKVKLIV